MGNNLTILINGGYYPLFSYKNVCSTFASQNLQKNMKRHTLLGIRFLIGLIVLGSCNNQESVRESTVAPGHSISFLKADSDVRDFNVCIQPLAEYVVTPADFEMRHFSIANDINTIIPEIKKIKEEHPDVHFYSLLPKVPVWLENLSNTDSLSRSAYSRYVGRYVNSYSHEGVIIERLLIVEGSKEAEFTSASELASIPSVQFETLSSTDIPAELNHEKIIYITK